MESFEDSNCHSMSDSFSLYERYMRSFNVVDNFVEDNSHREPGEPVSSSSNESSNSAGNIDLSTAIHTRVDHKHCETAFIECRPIVANYIADKGSSSLDSNLCAKIESDCASLAASLSDNSFATNSINEKSYPPEAPVSSEELKSGCFKHPVFITSTMENSNNAVDSVPMFRGPDVRHSESVFKLPISELSFNGTLKHVQKMKPIVDPIAALTSASNGLVNLEDKTEDKCVSDNSGPAFSKNGNTYSVNDISDDISSNGTNRTDKMSESTGDSQYEEFNPRQCPPVMNGANNFSKWNVDSSSSLEASFDSGVRSPDMFSDEDDMEPAPVSEPFWSFLKEYEAHDKKKVKKIDERLHGILPPPSITVLKIDATEMLKKYYYFLPAFSDDLKLNPSEINPVTPTKGVSFIEIPSQAEVHEETSDVSTKPRKNSLSKYDVKPDLDSSVHDKSIVLKMSTELEARETSWPDVMKCKYYDVYYNVTNYSAKVETLALRYGDRFIGAETGTSVCIYSGGQESPSSASKRKALRLMMAQAKSPGRRLSHLARRRQAFCSAATINEKAQSSTSRMVLIDKNFFPHRKLISTAERRSPRNRRTPGKKTPLRKTPNKTPKTKSGGSSRKKAMRRLLMDSDQLTRSQPTRETLKRALFISPENRKSIPVAPSTSVPVQAMKSRRALFGSPVTAETKSLDGTRSDHFLKRKRDTLDDEPESSRSKIAKSLSFGGDSIGSSQQHSLNRQASDGVTTKRTQLTETHKKKLLWAVSEALRVHGWRMSSAGFREKASALAQLTRRLLALPPHAARLASPKFSTSDTMLKIARQYVFAIIQGRTVDDCYQEEQMKLANEANSKITGYISPSAYQQFKARQAAAAAAAAAAASSSTFTSRVKENTCNDTSQKQDQPKSASKNILQDKLVNIDTNSNSSIGLSALDKSGILYKSNSMPSFEEAAKMRARRQISFDNVEFPKR